MSADHTVFDVLEESANRAFQAEMLSDFLQAEQAIVWDSRGKGTIAQLRSRGIPIEELAQRLTSLASDVRADRRGPGAPRETAVFLDADTLQTIMFALSVLRTEQAEIIREMLRAAIRRLHDVP